MVGREARRAVFFGWETSSGGGVATVGCGRAGGGCVVAGVCWGGCSIGSTGAVVAAGAAGTASTSCALLRQAIADTASKNTNEMVKT